MSRPLLTSYFRAYEHGFKNPDLDGPNTTRPVGDKFIDLFEEGQEDRRNGKTERYHPVQPDPEVFCYD